MDKDSTPLEKPKTPTPFLYHYTPFEAFKSIVNKGVIRGGHYLGLRGDDLEIRFGAEELRKAVVAHECSVEDQAYKNYLLEGIDGYLEGELEIYVACFTSTVDSQHHWDEYVNTPQGIAIGFDSNQVYKGFPTDITKRLGRVIPNPIRPKPDIRPISCRYFGRFDMAALVDEMFFGKRSYPPMFRSEEARRFVPFGLSISIYQVIVSIKRPKYEDDKEVRLFHLNPKENEYPVTTQNGKRFIEIDFYPIDAVKQVWIGPGPDQELCRKTVQDFVDAGRLKCEIHVSNLPPKEA